MALIRIQECSEQAGIFEAKVSFNQELEYHIIVRDPFSIEEEERLEWYFEEHLTFPFTDQVKAQEAAMSIITYGEKLFAQVFSSDPLISSAYKTITQEGVGGMQIEIVGQPSFHALHWEALKDPEYLQPLALQATIVRKSVIPQVLSTTVRPAPNINLLIVTARPRGSQDVSYRTISRPLVESLHQDKYPVKIDILRPGTYKALENHLRAVTEQYGVGYYHIIHFDVHGAVQSYPEIRHLLHKRYGRDTILPYEGRKAFLFLERETNSTADPLEATELAKLLLTHGVCAVILNACQSGKQMGERGASLASHLLQSGVQLVLAMSYSVTVAAAELMMRILYQQLLEGNELAIALCAVRSELFNHKGRRVHYNQEIPLEDWLLPVVYQNQPQLPSIRAFPSERDTTSNQHQIGLTSVAFLEPRYGFVGRDLDILYVERRLLMRRNILLIRGMSGVGKTTLLRHLSNWWKTTGFIKQVFYFGYNEGTWTTQQILFGIAHLLLDKVEYEHDFQSLSLDDQQDMLTRYLRAESHLLILDNLEMVMGFQLDSQSLFSPEEQCLLQRFLSGLTGGRTLVLLGSRSDEAWLAQGTFENNIYELQGLDPEATSTLAVRILERYHATRHLRDDDFLKLLKLLEGFPLALEVVLSNIGRRTPTEVLSAFQAGDVELDTGKSHEKTENILKYINYSYSSLSKEAQDLLLCFAPFQSIIYIPALNEYAACLKQQPAFSALPFEDWHGVLQEAMNWGLLSLDSVDSHFLRLQPTLSYFLSNQLNQPGKVERKAPFETAFRKYYEKISRSLFNLFRFRKSKDRRYGLFVAELEYENLKTALNLTLKAQESIEAFRYTLADYLNNSQNPRGGLELFLQIEKSLLAYPAEQLIGPLGVELVGVMGEIATWQRELKQYEEASVWYRKIGERLALLDHIDEEVKSRLQACTYEGLGSLAYEQHQLEEAERYYKLALHLRSEDDKDREGTHEMAIVSYDLGRVLQKLGKLEEAGENYNNALHIFVKFNYHRELGNIYFQLGNLALEQQKWIQAEKYYQQSFDIFIEFGEYDALNDIYSNLAVLKQKQQQTEKAIYYNKRALSVSMDQNVQIMQAESYLQLGHLELEQQQWTQAEQYIQKALDIFTELGDTRNQGSVYEAMGKSAFMQGQWTQAEQYFQKALDIFTELGDRHRQATIFINLGLLAQKQEQLTLEEQYYQQALPILVEYNDHNVLADICSKLGMVAQKQGYWEKATIYHQQALAFYVEFGDRQKQVASYVQLGYLAIEQRQWEQAEQYYQQAQTIFADLGDYYGVALMHRHLGDVASEQQQWAEAKKHFQEALFIFIDSKDKSLQAETYYDLGQVAIKQQQWLQAEQYFQLALQIKNDLDNR